MSWIKTPQSMWLDTPAGRYEIKGRKGNRYAKGEYRVYLNGQRIIGETSSENPTSTSTFEFLHWAQRAAHSHFQKWLEAK